MTTNTQTARTTTKAPKFLTGSLWLVDNSTNPTTLKDFRENKNENVDGVLTHGHLHPKGTGIEELLFECKYLKSNENSSFKLFLDEKGVIGKIEYMDIHQKEDFKGSFKRITTKSKLIIWGEWIVKENVSYLTLIELSY